MAADAPIDVWKIVSEHATAFRAVELGPDDAELIGTPDDLLDASTKAQFIRLDEKTERQEGPNGIFGPPVLVLKPSEPFSKLGGPPGATPEQASKWAEYAFLVRRVFNAVNVPILLFIDIQSRHLRDILKLVFWEAQYSPHFMNHARPSFPPSIILTRLPELIKIWNDLKAPGCQEDPQYAEYLKLLLDYMQTECADDIANVLEHLRDGVIGYKHLRSIFRPDQLIVEKRDGEYQILKCTNIDDDGYDVEIEGRRVESDGTKFGVWSYRLYIEKYTGLKKITDLDVYPLALAPNADEIRRDLMERGQKYASLRGIIHREYKGPVFDASQQNYEGRIMVDHVAYEHAKFGNIKLSPLDTLSPHVVSISDLGGRRTDATANTTNAGAILDPPPYHRGGDIMGCGYEVAATRRSRPPPPLPHDGVVVPCVPQRRGRTSIYHNKREADESPDVVLTEEHILLCPAKIPGFALADKTYCRFLVRHIKDLEWNPTAFDQVVIPDRHKHLLLSMIKGHNAHRMDRSARNDIIEGKGKGLVTLLHGPPGVGKTVTVEAIVEQTKQPLYIVSAAELGTHAADLEGALRAIFDVAFAWNAIVLIDEADVFLEARSLDFFRSELVTVFLRELEYFQGILVLTTNRVQRFDRALRSRIHLALKYNELDEEARLRVWKSALSTTGWVGSVEDIRGLARRKANGREIKYCVRSAVALAEQSGELLTASHFDTVLDLAEEFERELELGGTDDCFDSDDDRED